MKTFRMRPEDVIRRWYHIDARGQTLGHLAVRAAMILMGKDEPTFTPGVDSGGFVVVTGAEGVKVSGKKRERKIYRHHTGWVGGLVEESFDEISAKKPERIIELAVKRMLPKTKLGRAMVRRLKVYAGDTHPHAAQRPETVTVPPRGRVGQRTS